MREKVALKRCWHAYGNRSIVYSKQSGILELSNPLNLSSSEPLVDLAAHTIRLIKSSTIDHMFHKRISRPHTPSNVEHAFLSRPT